MTGDNEYQQLKAEALALRAKLIAVRGPHLCDAHGLMVGVMVAIERIRSRHEYNGDRDPAIFDQTDALIKELRESHGPL